MKDISTKNRDVIKSQGLNKETLYYTILFGVALITVLVLMIFGISNKNTGLIVYTAIIAPIFLAAEFASVRYTFTCNDTIYVEDDTLIIKTFLSTRRIPVGKIDKLTAGKIGNDDVTAVNITYGDSVARYKFKNFTKEEIAHLRRATSKY